MPRRYPRLAFPLLALVAGLCAGCVTDDGRTLDPPAGARPVTGPTVMVDGSLADAQTFGLGGFFVDSPVFPPGGPIPDVYTAAGNGVSPPLRWGRTPLGAKELALVMEDTAEDLPLWVVGGLDPALEGVREGELPPTAVVYLAGYPEATYHPPDPPPGENRAYRFTLYAMRERLELDPLAPSSEVIEAIEAAAFTRATFTGTVTGR